MDLILFFLTMLFCIALAIVVLIVLLLTVANILFAQYNIDLNE